MPRLALTPKSILRGAQRDMFWLRAERTEERGRRGGKKSRERDRFKQLLSALIIAALKFITCGIMAAQFPVQNNGSKIASAICSGESCPTGVADY